jgi:hypothetical protein
VKELLWAWEVYESTDVGGLEKYFSQLVAIHAAPKDWWHGLCGQLIKADWTVEEVEAEVRAIKAKVIKVKTRERPEITAITLTQWKEMDAEKRMEVLDWRERDYRYTLNQQKTEDIEWARFSHNPITISSREARPVAWDRVP